MLDVTLIRIHPDQVQAALRKRAAAPDIPAFLTLDTAFRAGWERNAARRLRPGGRPSALGPAHGLAGSRSSAGREDRSARTTVEHLRAERRRISTKIAALRREGTAAGEDRAAVPPPTEELHATAKALADELAQAEARLVELGVRHQEFFDALPNLPDDDVVAGGKECNQVVRTVGVPPVLGFPGRDHVRLAQELGLVDHRRGTALGGRG
ncbi:hypothetical protein ACFZAV_39365 [Streptomyces sp. NPDC008343]|uniref:hypothetical protein n=1 Tax=Streptomyces sp. NPDC008343 TaxID=3364828 RepID=UPI0036ECE9BC